MVPVPLRPQPKFSEVFKAEMKVVTGYIKCGLERLVIQVVNEKSSIGKKQNVIPFSDLQKSHSDGFVGSLLHFQLPLHFLFIFSFTYSSEPTQNYTIYLLTSLTKLYMIFMNFSHFINYSELIVEISFLCEFTLRTIRYYDYSYDLSNYI